MSESNTRIQNLTKWAKLSVFNRIIKREGRFEILNFWMWIIDQIAVKTRYIVRNLNSTFFEKTYTANAYRQTTDKLMFRSVISTVRWIKK